MGTDSEMLAAVREAFASVERPEHFTNFRHCDECAEHDETLRGRDLETLSHDDIGSGSWDPITMCTPDAFAYWMPALARLALDEPHSHWGWFGPQLFFQLERDGPRNERWAFCTPAQRAAVRRLLEHIVETRAKLIDDHWNARNEVLRAWQVWAED
ncbi:MAG TPA: DUF6714 family protein [Tepidiformaceae bacterium]|nr:DUF6714 family protein [Tepidiformaceae bacterium]